MRFLLVALIGFLTLSSVFGWDPGPAPGVKIKNAILYLLATGLLFQLAVDRKFVLQLPAMSVSFAVLIAYAILSYLAIVLVIDYPHYNVLKNAFDLKNYAVDQMLFFLVFFYGVRSQKDAKFVLQFLLLSWVLSHAIAVLDASGFVQIGDIERREDGRVQGAVGESNQYGAFVSMTLPAVIAAAVATRGLWRCFWAGAALLTAATLLMTVSRGAFVGVIAAGAAGAWLFRRYLSATRIITWAAGVTVALTLVVIVVGVTFGQLLYQRLVGDVVGTDLAGASSGRVEIWSNALEVMLEHPVTLLTGFGWNAYWSMPFRYSPHNFYLAQWFNLGLPGLACSVLLLALTVRTARAAVPYASADLRPILIGCVIATLAFAVATFFVDLYVPWLYFWAYAGLVLRMAINVSDGSLAPVAVPAIVPAQKRADAFGWIGVRQ
jgi:O-antigen ligase